jgi:hypothetical protein
MLKMPDAPAIVALWERAAGEHPIDRALSILAAFTRQPRDVLASLPVHRRDGLLVSSRVAAFGTYLEGTGHCPKCDCKVDASLHLPAMTAVPLEDGGVATLDGQEVSFRVPDSHDLADASRASDPTEARQRLLSRCHVSGPRHDGVEQLIEQELARLCDAASVELTMPCPQCGHEFVVPVDVSRFLWEEITDCALRLLDEVDALAVRYGWAEADILAMSERRRRLYLERYS